MAHKNNSTIEGKPQTGKLCLAEQAQTNTKTLGYFFALIQKTCLCIICPILGMS
jgi:hypothetical protein